MMAVRIPTRSEGSRTDILLQSPLLGSSTISCGIANRYFFNIFYNVANKKALNALNLPWMQSLACVGGFPNLRNRHKIPDVIFATDIPPLFITSTFAGELHVVRARLEDCPDTQRY